MPDTGADAAHLSGVALTGRPRPRPALRPGGRLLSGPGGRKRRPRPWWDARPLTRGRRALHGDPAPAPKGVRGVSGRGDRPARAPDAPSLHLRPRPGGFRPLPTAKASEDPRRGPGGLPRGSEPRTQRVGPPGQGPAGRGHRALFPRSHCVPGLGRNCPCAQSAELGAGPAPAEEDASPPPPPTTPSAPVSSGLAVGQEALASITHTCARLQVSGPAGDGDQPGVPHPGSLRVHV